MLLTFGGKLLLKLLILCCCVGITLLLFSVTPSLSGLVEEQLLWLGCRFAFGKAFQVEHTLRA
ncbi:hypothetical protein RA275_29155, partial [Pseudomonas syringae pv. tagetis]